MEVHEIGKKYIFIVALVVFVSAALIPFASKVMAGTCKTSDYCPGGYSTDFGCIAGKLYQNLNNYSVYGKSNCDDAYEKNVSLSLLYNFDTRAIYSWTNENGSVNKARPDADLSGCLPEYSINRITSFKVVYQDKHGDAFVRSFDLCFKDDSGVIDCYRGAVNSNFDLQTCTLIDVKINYDDNASKISRTFFSAGFTGCPKQDLINAGCKGCEIPGGYQCELSSDPDDEECNWHNDGSRIETAHFTVPGDYRLYTVENNFFTTYCDSDVWEIVDFEFDSEMTNNPPEVISVTPNSGISGTEEDEIDQSVCNDNNPLTYTFKFADKDGCDDIETMAFWIDESSWPDVRNMQESVHGVIRDNDGDGVYGAVGWKCDTAGTQTCGGLTGCDCYKNYQWNVPTTQGSSIPGSSSSPSMCSPAQGGTADKTTCSSSNTPGGWSVESMSCGLDPSLGYDVYTVNVKVWIYDDIGDDLNIFGHVRDKAGVTDSRGWVDLGDRLLDMEAPIGEVSEISHNLASDPDTLVFKQQVSDNHTSSSGLRSIYDRYYTVTKEAGDEYRCDIGGDGQGGNDCEYPDGDEMDLTDSSRVSYTREDERDGFRGGDQISAQVSASDKACNVSGSPTPYEMNDPLGSPWLITMYGAVYAALGYHDPIQRAEDPSIPLSTQWIGANVSAVAEWYFNVGRASSGEWVSRGYSDENRWAERGQSWYGTLYGLARRSDWTSIPGNKIENLDDLGNSLDLGDLGEGVFEYTSSGDLALSGNCNGEQVLFVEKADVYVEPDIDLADSSNSACLIVTKDGDVHIMAGDDVPDDSEDTVNMAFIVGGTFAAEEDPAFDRLKIIGFVFAKNTNFKRDLVLEDNLEYPAELIEFDPRYYWLRDKLGRRSYESFECGAVGTSDACMGWPIAD